MAEYSTPKVVKTISKGGFKVVLNKVQKVGTTREFFYPTFNGNRISTTLFGRLYDAVNLGNAYLNHKIKQEQENK